MNGSKDQTDQSDGGIDECGECRSEAAYGEHIGEGDARIQLSARPNYRARRRSTRSTRLTASGSLNTSSTRP